jgi:RNA methyltransferase, TrmH family
LGRQERGWTKVEKEIREADMKNDKSNSTPSQENRGQAHHEREPSREGVITSRNNRWLKVFRAALRGSGPGKGEPICVEGPKLIGDAVRSGLAIEALLVNSRGTRALGQVLEARSQSEAEIPRPRIFETTDRLFAGIVATETPQGIAALLRPRVWGFDDVLRGSSGSQGAFRGDPALVVVLAGVQDPGNVGSIVRSAESFGATGVIATRGTADPWSPKALRASAGSALRLPVLRGMATPVLLAQLRIARIRIYATSSRAETQTGARRVNGADLRVPAAILIGNEGAGLTREFESAADATIWIPITCAVESLNAAVAASVVLYEAARQRSATS